MSKQLPEHLNDIGIGWHPLLLELHERLAGFDYEVLQVKEKWGLLRVYVSVDGEAHPFFDLTILGAGTLTGTTEDGSNRWQQAYEIIHEFEVKSATVCEDCGEPGVLRTDRYWLRTLCDSCA